MIKVAGDKCRRVILGTAVGDSIGLPAEGLSRRTIEKRWPGPWHQRLLFGHGMVSDDTEHTVFVIQSLIHFHNDSDAFQRALSWKLRWWLLCVPAGIGFATLRAILKLWLGFGPRHSGVFSAGNGPAMRSAVIGAFFAEQPEKIRAFVSASTRLTHTDPKAEVAATAVALTAAWTISHSSPPDQLLVDIWKGVAPEDVEWNIKMDLLGEGMSSDKSVEEIAATLGFSKGVTGYAYATVPVALYAWWSHYGDFRKSLESVIRCGGDTDTVGAIVGGLAALDAEIPEDWVEGLCDWPISVGFLSRLGIQADQLLVGKTVNDVSLPWLFLPMRNLLFLTVVLSHGFRRLLPF